VADLHFPDGVVPLVSRFYIERGDLQAQCEQAISPPSGLLRIQAPAQMGKTSGLERLVAYAQGLNYRVVQIDLRLVDKTALQDLDQLLQWLCRQVCKQLNRQIAVQEHWNVDFGSLAAACLCTRQHTFRVKPIESYMRLCWRGSFAMR
jgi:AAA-like domain